VHERALEQAAHDLDQRRGRALQTTVLAGGAFAFACAAIWLSMPVAVAFATGALLEALVAAEAAHGRRQLVARLALQPAAYALPEVAAYGAEAAQPRQRARLAAWLSEVVADADARYSPCLCDRVKLVSRELEALARELISPMRSIEPASAVACRRLLTHMTESPLYNADLSVDDLRVALRRIRAGIA
jgi:hypothetical protein